MARGLKNTNSICRSILEVSQGTRKQNDEILSLSKQQKEENKKRNSLLETKVPDLKEYFPVKDSATLRRFLDESDGLFPVRRSLFYDMCHMCVHKKQNLFGTALLRSCFSQEYINSHVWPSKRYIIFMTLSFFFNISNICVPFSLVTHKSLMRLLSTSTLLSS